MESTKTILDLVSIKKWARKTEGTMKAMLTKNGKKNSRIYNDINIEVTKTKDGVLIETDLPDYAIFVDKGRKRGKMPPVKNIVAWCKRKSIPKEAAFPIARKIGERGLKGTNFLSPLRKLTTLIEEIQSKSLEIIVKDINETIKK